MWSKWQVAHAANSFSWSTYVSNVIGNWIEDVAELIWSEKLIRESNYQHVKWNISGIFILHGDILMKMVFSNCVTGILLNSVCQLRLWTIKADEPETPEVCQLDWDCLLSAKAVQVDTLRSITDGTGLDRFGWFLMKQQVAMWLFWLWKVNWRRFIKRPCQSRPRSKIRRFAEHVPSCPGTVWSHSSPS